MKKSTMLIALLSIFLSSTVSFACDCAANNKTETKNNETSNPTKSDDLSAAK